MFASLDPVAIDVACADAVNARQPIAGSLLDEQQKAHDHHDHFTTVSPDTNWKSAIEHGVKIGLGNSEYELVVVK